MVDPSMLAVSRPESQVSASGHAIIVDATFSNVSSTPFSIHWPLSWLHPSVPVSVPSSSSSSEGWALSVASPHVPAAAPAEISSSSDVAGGLLAVMPLFAAHPASASPAARRIVPARVVDRSIRAMGHMRTPGVLTDRRASRSPGRRARAHRDRPRRPAARPRRGASS